MKLLADPDWMASVKQRLEEIEAAFKAAEEARIEAERQAELARVTEEARLTVEARLAEERAFRSLYYELTVQKCGEFIVGWGTDGVQVRHRSGGVITFAAC